MAKSGGIPALIELIEPLVRERGYDLVDLVWGNSFRRRTLAAYIDKPGGVLVDDCQSLAREIGKFLDEQDLVQSSYVLEVSSPGAERPLKTDKDFLYFVGRYALVRTKEPLEEIGRNEVYGYLRGLMEDRVLLETEQGVQLSIPRENIAKARLAIKF